MTEVTRDEMKTKWMGAGEQLDDDELAYVIANNIGPGFNDHSSKSLLDAYRAGYRKGYMDCGEEWRKEHGF